MAWEWIRLGVYVVEIAGRSLSREALGIVFIQADTLITSHYITHQSAKVSNRTGTQRREKVLTIQPQEIRRDEQLKAQLNGDIHIRHRRAVAVAVPIVEVLYHLFHDVAAIRTKSANAQDQ